MNIETSELIERLINEEQQRHDANVEQENDRHEKELSLIRALETRINEWAETDKPAESQPQPEVKRRGRKPGRKPKLETKKREIRPEHAPVAPAPEIPRNNGYVPMREKIARDAAVNCAAEARAWIAENGSGSFTMDQVVEAIHKKTTLGESTIRSRLHPFFAYLQEKGQMVVTGDKRNHAYTPTETFDANPKKRAQADAAPAPSLSSKEAAYRELRGGMALPKTSED